MIAWLGIEEKLPWSGAVNFHASPGRKRALACREKTSHWRSSCDVPDDLIHTAIEFASPMARLGFKRKVQRLD
jgi:hypothetical protein